MSEYQWKTETLYLKDFVDKGELPQVVRIDSSTTGPVDLGSLFDTSQPFILYSQRIRSKVLAETVTWDTVKKEYVAEGPFLEIPKDYPGWFEILPPDGTDPDNCCRSVEQIWKSKCTYFLAQNTTAGFKCVEDETGLVLQEDHKVYPGEFLKVLKVCSKKWRTRNSVGGQSGEASVKQLETKYLKCQDPMQNVIALPFAHPGKFSAVGKPDAKDKKAVYQMQHLLQEFDDFPFIVKLVFGTLPDASTAFSGTLRILRKYRQETLVTCGLESQSTILMEIPTDIYLHIQKADESCMKISEKKQKEGAVADCRKHVFAYVVSIKVLDKRYRRRPDLDTENGKKTHGILANASDMNKFDPNAVYPPPDGPPAESWALTFKDPETLRKFASESHSITDHGGVEAHTASNEETLKLKTLDRQMSEVSETFYPVSNTVADRRTSSSGTKSNVSNGFHRRVSTSSDERNIQASLRSHREAPC